MSQLTEITHTQSVRLSDDENAVIIIDQTRLPGHLEYLNLSSAGEI